MQISNVATMTRDVIDEHGFEGYQPTIIFPERRIVRSVADVPDGVDHEQVALGLASQHAEPGEEYFVVFRHSDTEFKVIHMHEGKSRAEVFSLEA